MPFRSKKTRHPFILDENITGMNALLRGIQDKAMDVVNIKPKRKLSSMLISLIIFMFAFILAINVES